MQYEFTPPLNEIPLCCHESNVVSYKDFFNGRVRKFWLCCPRGHKIIVKRWKPQTEITNDVQIQ